MKKCIIILLLLTGILSGSLLLNSCRKTDVHVLHTTPLTFTVPDGFPQPVYNFQANPVTEEGFELGRKLFYEGRLSLDGNFPCSSCHQQVAAFTTFEHDRSHGYNHSHTLRNSPGLANLAWYPAYNQNGSATTLEQVSLNHITAPNEMAETMDHVISKLQGDTMYQRLFTAAYGDNKITSDRLLKALSQFVINLVSSNTKYDQMLKGQYIYNSEEQAGYQVFQAKCAVCHKEPLFTDFTYRNVGLPIDSALNDFGRMRVTGKSSDSLKFRVPSLRNLALTSYYTHDGRFSTFRMMIDHYRNGVIQSPTLDPLLSNGIRMTDLEEYQLMAFLYTLSDSSYLTNPRFHP